jgi:two-component system NtrC family sensor kinase
MTLRRKMLLQIAATIVGLLLTIGASLWGLNGLRQDYGLALTGYSDLRGVFEAGSHLATARTLLAPAAADRGRARIEVQTAAEMFQIFDAERSRGSAPLSLSKLAAVNAGMRAADAQLAAPAGSPEADVDSVAQAMGRVGDLAAEIRQLIQASQDAAREKRRTTFAAMGAVSALAVLGAIALGVWQYLGVIRPLARLNLGVRKIARGRFSQRVDVRGNDEIASLAVDFNRMAEELDGLYRELEHKVAQTSRELVRSERLASVGYLAAGVAHEINNPLGIISGYAEMSLEQLKQLPPSDEGGGEIRKSLQVICDEAFRCKDIIVKLLTLAGGGDEKRSIVNMAEVTREVVGMVGALRDFRERRIEIKVIGCNNLMVTANEVEMKQVVLNLLVNALEASPAQDGEVRVELEADDGVVRLAVVDNGNGLTAEAASRVFEPFYSNKRGTLNPGTGLGLSITHAIVESHGGRIRAQSEGAGKGSRFVVELPAARQIGGTE